MRNCISVEQYVFRELTEFDPEREAPQQRINAPKIDLYARNAKALMDVPLGPNNRPIVNRKALAVAITAASISPHPSNPVGLRAMRRIYATLRSDSESAG